MSEKFADLHMHTTVSDGTDTLEKRVDDARERGLDCIAITDHDTLNPELDDRVQEIDGVEVISGAEIKAGLDGRKIEILGYFLDSSDTDIQNLLERIGKYRKERMLEMIAEINERIDADITLEDVAEVAETTLGRPHLARVLVKKGVVENVREAFDRYLASGRPGYVEAEKIPAEEVIDTIHENGGVASLAHPGRSFSRENVERGVKELANAGLDAIEVDYPYERLRETGSFNPAFGRDVAQEMAEKYKLIWTGGSDCHGSRGGKYFLGEIRLPYEQVVLLKERADV